MLLFGIKITHRRGPEGLPIHFGQGVDEELCVSETGRNGTERRVRESVSVTREESSEHLTHDAQLAGQAIGIKNTKIKHARHHRRQGHASLYAPA